MAVCQQLPLISWLSVPNGVAGTGTWHVLKVVVVGPVTQAFRCFSYTETENQDWSLGSGVDALNHPF